MAAARVGDGLRALELLSELLFGRRDPKLYARPALIQALHCGMRSADAPAPLTLVRTRHSVELLSVPVDCTRRDPCMGPVLERSAHVAACSHECLLVT